MGALFESLGEPAAAWLERAQSAETKERLRRSTEEAQRLGIFGAPTFVGGTEVFWGNDRLEDALEWRTKEPRRRRMLYSIAEHTNSVIE